MRRLAIVTSLLVLAVSGPAFGQVCVDYGSLTRVAADIVTPTLAGDIVVDGGYAFVACSDNNPTPPYGLMVFDLGDPLAPELVGTGGAPATRYGLALDADRVFLVGPPGLEILSVADPLAPATLGSTPLGSPRAVKIVGDRAFVADFFDGLVVVDVADPTAPQEETRLDLGTPAFDLAVAGGLAYVATEDSLVIVDVSTPASPSVVGSLYLGGGSLRTLELAGQTVYLGQFPPNTRVVAVDVGDPSAPDLLDELPVAYPYGIRVVGGTAYVTEGYGDLVLVDVADPANMGEVHRIEAPGRRIAPGGPYLFMGSTNGQPRLKTIALGVDDTPDPIGGYTLLPTVRYVRVGSGGAQVIGVQNNDYVLDTLDISGGGPQFPLLDHRRICDYEPFSAVDLRPGLMAFAAEDAVHLVDIADPTDTRVAGSFVHGERIRSVNLQGNVLFVIDGFGVHAYDVADAGAVAKIGYIQRFELRGASRVGDLLFVAHEAQGLNVFDVGDPAAPVLRGVLGGASFQGVVADGDHAYLTGVLVTAIADVSDPDAPFLVWMGGSQGDAQNIQKFGDLVFGPAGCGSLEILDVGDPLAPVRLAAPVVPGCSSLDVAMSAGKILIAAGDGDLLAYAGHCAAVSPVPPPPAPTRDWNLTVAPNPFNPVTRIGVEIPVSTRVTMRVYGLDGTMVKELFAGGLPAGPFSVSWDGRDTAGQPVASGAYMMLLDSPAGRQSTRMLLIK